jgi:prepilin-type N-terminal cleavage/methylation domain-containing protein
MIRRAFSVIELMIVMAIIAVIASIVIPKLAAQHKAREGYTASYALKKTRTYAVPIICLNCGTEHKAEFTVGVAVPDELTHICPNCQLNTALVPKHLTTQPAEKEKQP